MCVRRFFFNGRRKTYDEVLGHLGGDRCCGCSALPSVLFFVLQANVREKHIQAMQDAGAFQSGHGGQVNNIQQR